MKNLIKANIKKGFSLVELLVVIAVIGVIAAIAIPAMSGIFGKSEGAKAKRNAQSIVSTFNSARAAGNKDSFPAKATVAAADLGALIGTGLTGSGSFAGSTFSAPMTSGEATKALTAASGGSTVSLVGDTANSTVMQVTAQ